jgi:electron transfer flavoprotein alpha/beta subunit
MAAKKKEIRKVAPASLPAPRTSVVALDVPRKTKQTQFIAGSPAEAARGLVGKLKNEARVIG